MPTGRKDLLFHLYRVIIQKIKYPRFAQLIARVVWNPEDLVRGARLEMPGGPWGTVDSGDFPPRRKLVKNRR